MASLGHTPPSRRYPAAQTFQAFWGASGVHGIPGFASSWFPPLQTSRFITISEAGKRKVSDGGEQNMRMRVHTCVFMFVSISSGAIGAGFWGGVPVTPC